MHPVADATVGRRREYLLSRRGRTNRRRLIRRNYRIELPARIPGNQLNHQVFLIGDEPFVPGDISEMPEQQIPTRDGRGRRWNTVAGNDFEDEQRRPFI